MLDLLIIKYENLDFKTTETEVFTSESFALGALSDLMAKDEIQVKAVINVVDGVEVKVVSPAFKEGKLVFEENYKGSIGSVEEGPYVMAYIEGDNYETVSVEDEVEIKKIFSQKQCISGFVYLFMFKLDIEAAVLMPLKVEIENFKFILKENIKKKGGK